MSTPISNISNGLLNYVRSSRELYRYNAKFQHIRSLIDKYESTQNRTPAQHQREQLAWKVIAVAGIIFIAIAAVLFYKSTALLFFATDLTRTQLKLSISGITLLPFVLIGLIVGEVWAIINAKKSLADIQIHAERQLIDYIMNDNIAVNEVFLAVHNNLNSKLGTPVAIPGTRPIRTNFDHATCETYIEELRRTQIFLAALAG